MPRKDAFALTDRPRRRDGFGVVHVGYWWSKDAWEPLCECRTVASQRDTDEPLDALVTCVYCWYVLMNPGVKAIGEL
jgi:hypothetical protein